MAFFDEIEARVAELNEQFADLQRRMAGATDEVSIGEPITGGAGLVRVDIGGQLIGVTFVPDALWHLDERRLGPQIVAAMRAAEAKAAEVREAMFGPIELSEVEARI